ncbi:hypothetical protein K0M31_004009 [Melipona bicolor]|uniref:Uncharacterized protein n=1 Tax=Melipona bicolor TaxID=60889 RepID=A0AA40KP55_9HYME|nr:hypothetical protein K0M31_004009 [Melipona bicolor]
MSNSCRVNSRSGLNPAASQFRSPFRHDVTVTEAVGTELWRDESVERRKPLERDTNFQDKRRRSVATYPRARSTTVAVKRNEMNDVALSGRAYRDLTDPVWLMDLSDEDTLQRNITPKD